MRPSDLEACRLVAVYGHGRAGRALVRHVRAVAPDAAVLVLLDGDADDDTAREATTVGFDLAVGPAAAEALRTQPIDVVLRSPGVSPYREPLALARERGIPVTTATNVWFGLHRPDNVVAITATKGKSTTTALTTHLLQAAGRTAVMAGNIGLPLLDLPRPPHDVDHVVVELSSYQLADFDGHVAVGALLNLMRDHVDWHGSDARYHADKARLLDHADVVVANAADTGVVAAVADHTDPRWFDVRQDPAVVGRRRIPVADLHAALSRSRLVGGHHVANLAAALAIVEAVEVDPTSVLDAVADFAPLPHRLEVVHDDGRLWIDDSISTIPETAVAALRAFPDRPITLLAGGHDRTQDHTPLVAEIARRAEVHVVTMPDTGTRLGDDLAQAGLEERTLVAGDLADAVRIADRDTPPGGVVLLSPAAPSFGAFTSYEERGDRFATLARGLS